MNDEQLEDLLRSAGRGDAPNSALSESLRASTEAAWQDAVIAHRRRQAWLRWRWVSVAAALVTAIALYPWGANNGAQAPVLAEVRVISGGYTVNQAADVVGTLVADDTVRTSADALIAVSLRSGAQLSLSGDTELTLLDAATLSLRRGKIYVDSPSVDSRLRVETSWGLIRDIGTQFEVNAAGDALEVKMREGKVQLSTEKGVHYASVADGQGEVLRVDADQRVSSAQIATHDAYWQWASGAVAPLPLDGKSVLELLDWVARVTGKRVNYASQQVEQMARETRLSGGKITAESLQETLPLLMKTTRLSAIVSDATIEIGLFSEQ